MWPRLILFLLFTLLTSCTVNSPQKISNDQPNLDTSTVTHAFEANGFENISTTKAEFFSKNTYELIFKRENEQITIYVFDSNTTAQEAVSEYIKKNQASTQKGPSTNYITYRNILVLYKEPSPSNMRDYITTSLTR
jgi:hypothetical protein